MGYGQRCTYNIDNFPQSFFIKRINKSTEGLFNNDKQEWRKRVNLKNPWEEAKQPAHAPLMRIEKCAPKMQALVHLHHLEEKCN